MATTAPPVKPDLHPELLRTLPSDAVRQIQWRFADRYDLHMLVQSARFVARGPVARLVANGGRNSHEWTPAKAELLEAFDKSGITAVFMEPEQGGFIAGPKNLAPPPQAGEDRKPWGQLHVLGLLLGRAALVDRRQRQTAGQAGGCGPAIHPAQFKRYQPGNTRIQPTTAPSTTPPWAQETKRSTRWKKPTAITIWMCSRCSSPPNWTHSAPTPVTWTSRSAPACRRSVV